MFRNTSNIIINGGTFTDFHQRNEASKIAMDRLLEASSPGAFHNSADRFDPPKCHPKTRIAVLQKVMEWYLGHNGWDAFIMWLYGPAGAGKSAIAQTFAEQHSSILLASYFFSRTDPSRNHQKALAASLSYQMTLKIPGLRGIIESTIEEDPFLFERNFEAQSNALIIGPLIQLSDAGSFLVNTHPSLIIIDGLDECHGSEIQQNIVVTISSVLQQHRGKLSIKLVIASRPEYHLTMAFSSPCLSEMTSRLALDDTYKPDADIEHYLIDSFDKIRTMHPLRAHIPPSWPAREVIDKLVKKSSGQFIYAATVIKYMSSPHHRPAERLKVILGLLPASKNDRPYAELDALYTNILSNVQDTEATLQVLGVFLHTHNYLDKSPEGLEQFMFLDRGAIRLLLLDLTSVVNVEDEEAPIQFLHASFGDFLLDPTRSLDYFINPAQVHATISSYCIQHICTLRSYGWKLPLNILEYAFECTTRHIEKALDIDDLREKVHDMPYIQCWLDYSRMIEGHSWFHDTSSDLLLHFFDFLRTSKFTHPEALYLHHRDIWDDKIRDTLSRMPTSDVSLSLCIVFADVELPQAETDAHSLKKLISETTPHTWPYNNVLSILDDIRLLVDHERPVGRKAMMEFLTDPLRAGPYILDEKQYTTVAVYLLEWIDRPPNYQRFDIKDGGTDARYQVILDIIRQILPKTGCPERLLSNQRSLTSNVERRVDGQEEEADRLMLQKVRDYMTGSVSSLD